MNKKKIVILFTLVQIFNQISHVSTLNYISVFLSYRGLSDSAISFWGGSYSIFMVISQLIISSFAQKRAKYIKKIIVSLYILSLMSFAILYQFDMNTILLLIIYTIGWVLILNYNTMITPMYMQYRRAGVNVNVGFPIGCGNAVSAIASIYIGKAIMKYNPDITLLIYIISGILCSIAIICMPKIDYEKLPEAYSTSKSKPFIQIIKENKILVIYSLSMMLQSLGSVPITTFAIRIIENIGGNVEHLSISNSIASLAAIPAMLFSGLYISKFKHSSLIYFTYIVMFIRVCLYFVCDNMIMYYVLVATSIVTVGVKNVVSVFFVDNMLDDDEKITGTTLTSLTSVFGLCVGSIIFGVLAGKVDIKGQLIVSVFFNFVAMLVMYVCKKLADKKFINQ